VQRLSTTRTFIRPCLYRCNFVGPLDNACTRSRKTRKGTNGHFPFLRNLDRNVPEIVIRYSNRRPALVCCHSNPDCEKLAVIFATAPHIGHRDRENLLNGIPNPGCQAPKSPASWYWLSPRGTRGRRASLVVIKGTMVPWRGGGSGYKDLDRASLLQMIGRAGRPVFNFSGTVVVATDNFQV
jgi:hypothetical protein